MTKQIVLGAFEEVTPNFIGNSWSHEKSDTRDFASLAYWQELARELDRGGFDFLFLAEALGYPMSGEDVPEVVIREAVQLPVHDPMTLISGLAATVDRLGFAVTTSTTAQHPYLNARALTSLDHLTGGRIAWNVVTSDNQVALVKLLGQTLTPHDERYRRASEFLDLSLKMWEEGWDDDAIVYDKSTRTFADPAKVHRIRHDGEYFQLDGYYPSTPSVQRTPAILQAGTSSAGRAFAAKYAECVFISDRDLDLAARNVASLRELAAAEGRDPGAPRVITDVSIVVGDTEAEAASLRESLDRSSSRESSAALFMGWSGVDLMRFAPDQTLADVSTEVGQATLAIFQNGDDSPTVGEILDRIATSIGGPRVTGTPSQVADQLQAIVEKTDVDGFLVQHMYGGPHGYTDFIDHVMPILRERGMVPQEPRRGSMRERLTGSTSPRLHPTHPGRANRP